MKRILGVFFLCGVLFSDGIFAAEKVSYFPKDSAMHRVDKAYLGELLSSVGEPVLSAENQPKDYFAFRLICTRAFKPHKIVRYERKNGEVTRRVLVTTEETKKILQAEVRKLGDVDIAILEDDLKAAKFWELKPHEEGRKLFLDGSDLTIELVKDGKHIVFQRYDPHDEAEERGLEEMMRFVEQLFSGLWLNREAYERNL